MGNNQTIGRNQKRERDIVITLVHIFGMIMILFCYIFQKIGLYALGEICIIGVPLFFFVSGYLCGRKPINNSGKWLLKKALRVLLPYLLFVWCVFAIHEIANTEEVSLYQWLVSSSCLHGIYNYAYWRMDLLGIHYAAVPGTGHFWYVTIIMLCYLMTPLLQKFRETSLNRVGKILVTLAAIALMCGTIFLGFQLAYFLIYTAGFFTGAKKVRTDGKYYIIITCLMIVITFLRFLLKVWIDGSDFYDRTFVLINNGVLAIWLFYTAYFLQSKMPKVFSVFNVGVVHFFEKISYFVYLTHYIFLQGGLATTNYISNIPLAILVAMLLTFVTAVTLWVITDKLIPLLFQKQQNKLNDK